MALPRASGDATYIVAPFLLGLVADSPKIVTGAECAVAGVATILGVLVLALLGGGEAELEGGADANDVTVSS